MSDAARFQPAAGGVTVFHIERFLTTFAPIGRDELARHALARRFDATEAQAEKLRALLAQTPLAETTGAIDARWELRFGDASAASAAWAACWLDRTGTRLATRDSVYAIDDPARSLITWLRGTFGEDDVPDPRAPDVPAAGAMPSPLPPS